MGNYMNLLSPPGWRFSGKSPPLPVGFSMAMITGGNWLVVEPYPSEK